MPRTATPTPERREVAVNEALVAKDMAAAAQLGSLQASYSQGRDLVNQLLGQAQAFQAAGNLLQTFGVSKLAFVKENKLYQQLSGMIGPNGLELKGTWIEFCGLLGISDEKANQDIANLKSFGEEALESMQRMGIGYRELRQYRKLPDDQKQALIEVAKVGDKEGFVELAEEIIAKHAKEKEALAQKLDESKKEQEATEKRLDVVRKQKEEAEALAARIAVMAPDEALADLQAAATRIAADALGAIQGGVRQALNKLHELPEGVLQPAFAAGLVGQLQAELNRLRNDFGLPDVAGAEASQLAAEVSEWAAAK